MVILNRTRAAITLLLLGALPYSITWSQVQQNPAPASSFSSTQEVIEKLRADPADGGLLSDISNPGCNKELLEALIEMLQEGGKPPEFVSVATAKVADCYVQQHHAEGAFELLRAALSGDERNSRLFFALARAPEDRQDEVVSIFKQLVGADRNRLNDKEFWPVALHLVQREVVDPQLAGAAGRERSRPDAYGVGAFMLQVSATPSDDRPRLLQQALSGDNPTTNSQVLAGMCYFWVYSNRPGDCIKLSPEEQDVLRAAAMQAIEKGALTVTPAEKDMSSMYVMGLAMMAIRFEGPCEQTPGAFAQSGLDEAFADYIRQRAASSTNGHEQFVLGAAVEHIEDYRRRLSRTE